MRSSSFSAVSSLVVLVLLSFAMGACGGRQVVEERGATWADRAYHPERLRYGTLDLSLLEEEVLDVNGDGIPDIFRYRRGGALVAERHDLNFDGRVDMTSYYDASGQLVEQEFQLDYDDIVDVVRVYEGGVLVEKHVSMEFDGTFSLTKYYSTSGDLLRIERDSNQDGLVDVWEYYDEGSLVRVGRDLDGDGLPELLTDIN